MTAAGTTWDGLPISEELPHGVTVVVYRWVGGRLEVLLLHRAHRGPAYEGDWAWTPPAGSRFPGEPVEACARRELREEAGLELELRPTGCGSAAWYVCAAQAPPEAAVTVAHDPEHDRFAWVPAGEAVARCRPAVVAESLACVVALIGQGGPGAA
jgi:8-oxo-dGTP pyrophosphatase MutT (NUDIX family)